MPIKTAVKTVMPQRPRAQETFDEVNLGFTEARAQFEAQRCLQCQDPACERGCPVRIPIRAFIQQVVEGRYREAYHTIVSANALPSVCGRVCPQEDQCEKACHLAVKFEPVGIGHLERFVADWARLHGDGMERPAGPLTGPKIAVIGSGPSGLTAAGDLARQGFRVTVFEALHEPGGVLRYGIPEFRLPKAVLDHEIDALRRLGVSIECNVVIGKTLKVSQLFQEMGFEAVFVGTGAGLPRFLGIPGENLNGVYSANEFLTRMNLMKAYEFPSAHTPLKVGTRVAVVGAGNTAMDALRSALRMGAKEVHMVYRRSEKEMSARVEEYHHAKGEGVQFHWLMNPVRVVGSDHGWVTALECDPQRLGEADASGRARPVSAGMPPVRLEVDTVVVAIGNAPNKLLTRDGDFAVKEWGGLMVDDRTGETSCANVFAGGDAVTGAATVILAAGAGKRAAAAIAERLKGKRNLPGS